MPTETIQAGALPQERGQKTVAAEGSRVPWRLLADEDSCPCHKARQRKCVRGTRFTIWGSGASWEGWREAERQVPEPCENVEEETGLK